MGSVDFTPRIQAVYTEFKGKGGSASNTVSEDEANLFRALKQKTDGQRIELTSTQVKVLEGLEKRFGPQAHAATTAKSIYSNYMVGSENDFSSAVLRARGNSDIIKNIGAAKRSTTNSPKDKLIALFQNNISADAPGFIKAFKDLGLKTPEEAYLYLEKNFGSPSPTAAPQPKPTSAPTTEHAAQAQEDAEYEHLAQVMAAQQKQDPKERHYREIYDVHITSGHLTAKTSRETAVINKMKAHFTNPDPNKSPLKLGILERGALNRMVETYQKNRSQYLGDW